MAVAVTVTMIETRKSETKCLLRDTESHKPLFFYKTDWKWAQLVMHEVTIGSVTVIIASKTIQNIFKTNIIYERITVLLSRQDKMKHQTASIHPVVQAMTA